MQRTTMVLRHNFSFQRLSMLQVYPSYGFKFRTNSEIEMGSNNVAISITLSALPRWRRRTQQGQPRRMHTIVVLSRLLRISLALGILLILAVLLLRLDLVAPLPYALAFVGELLVLDFDLFLSGGRVSAASGTVNRSLVIEWRNFVQILHTSARR